MAAATPTEAQTPFPPPTAWREIPSSVISQRTSNPIRKIVDQMALPPKDPNKPLLSLSVGDPTIGGALNPPAELYTALDEAIANHSHAHETHGRQHAIGAREAREAVANFFSTPEGPLTADDVIFASGCSGALDIVLNTLLNEGDSVLLPQPGFSLYNTISAARGFVAKFYRLLPGQNWEADLDHLRSLIDPTTKAILVNNPSNPCGSVYSREHLEAILGIADAHGLPVVADEIYSHVLGSSHRFFPMASLTRTVPVLSVGGMAKQFVVPGWRVGWTLVHDRNNRLSEVRRGLAALEEVNGGAATYVLAALPRVLRSDLSQHFRDVNTLIERNTTLVYDALSHVPGLVPCRAQGAMYQMVEIAVDQFPGFESDRDFSIALLREEQVMVLPGQCFGVVNFFRVVTSLPSDYLAQACQRIEHFCRRHHQPHQNGGVGKESGEKPPKRACT
eukprot:TRINITY_DN3311_c0_g1_i1.p1 TRINITY_DN3311_c0_g1~~TRINITY_DN3311_c0_g1_i1.p1  ORF type:complete len:448 (-),score=92.61 TRINITY_DN3311_c0_g1_i1:15-1358(-)